MIHLIREDHPTMSLKSMYIKIQPQGIGRDRFIEMCVEHGLRAQMPTNKARTTDSTGVIRYPNLVKELDVCRVNQVWVSDITYFNVGGKFYYLTFIMDMYSRYIKGYCASASLHTEETTLRALKMALKEKDLPDQIIFHSDGGGQYYSKAFVKLTTKMKMLNSMAKEAYENPYAERINGVIKNCYLMHRSIKTFDDLVKELDRAVRLYNFEKPHMGLNYLTPAQIEGRKYISKGQSAKGDKSLKAKHVTNGTSSLLATGQTTKGSNVHLAR